VPLRGEINRAIAISCKNPVCVATLPRWINLHRRASSNSEQGWLGAQELLVGCRCRRSLILASTMLLRVGLALQELPQNLILLGHQILHCGS
jgi:hypothetical protein